LSAALLITEYFFKGPLAGRVEGRRYTGRGFSRAIGRWSRILRLCVLVREAVGRLLCLAADSIVFTFSVRYSLDSLIGRIASDLLSRHFRLRAR
jgi:hypothetical protein